MMTMAGMYSRRTFLHCALSSGVAAFLPSLTLANAAADSRLVLVLLRGALDGLAAVPAYGDSAYTGKRGALAISSTAQKLDGLFALHPSLAHLHERWRARELIVFHAIASPYRERSHFDGQDLLESGGAKLMARDGWLNRLLPTLAAQHARTSDGLALALAQNVPLVLRGEARVSSWAPSRLPEVDSDTLQRIADLYARDATLAARLQTALAADAAAGDNMGGRGRRDPLNPLAAVAGAAGEFLAAADGPRIAVIETGGWDTHANQGAENGQLANRLRALDSGINSLRTALGAAWSRTAVLIVTEFGRTVAINGTRGTDHGTATCAFLVGGAVNGGRIVADWPGLASSALYQGRDLKPTLDLRAVFKGVLAAQFDVAESVLEERIFPDSRAARALEGLIRA
jgi:uncharacterized protein (DUF1501 family)